MQPTTPATWHTDEAPDEASDKAIAPNSARETRQRLIDAAMAVFLEKGYAQTRVQDIARRAGLTTGAMYAHFEGKAALLAEAIAESGDVAIDQILESLDDRLPDALGVALGIDALSGPANPFHRLTLEAFAAAARGEASQDLLAPALARMRERMEQRVREARADGMVDDEVDDSALVGLFQRLILGSVVAKAVGLPPEEPGAAEALVLRFLSSLVPSQD